MTKVVHFSHVAAKYRGDATVNKARKALCAQRPTLWTRIWTWLQSDVSF